MQLRDQEKENENGMLNDMEDKKGISNTHELESHEERLEMRREGDI